MSCCARCGQNICSTAGKIALNKVWHKGCFCCYNCNRPLQINNAKIYYGEVFCSCCCPQLQEVYPTKICRINSTPSFNPDCCCPGPVKQPCCVSSDSDCWRPRDIHSCSCIPACCQECDDGVPVRRVAYCRTSSPPKPTCYPPRRQHSPRRCPCPKCCPKRRVVCPEPCCQSVRRINRCPSPCSSPCPSPCPSPCSPSPCPPPPAVCNPMPPTCRRRSAGCQPCSNPGCKCCTAARCRRCGEKVFAAEKVLTSYGAYHIGCFSCYCCCKSLCVKTMFEACGEIYCKQCYNNYFGVSGYGYTCC